MRNQGSLYLRIKEIFADFQSCSTKERILILLKWIGIFAVCFVIGGVLIGWLFSPIAKVIKVENTNPIYLGLGTKLGRMTSLLIGGGLFLLIVLVNMRKDVGNRIRSTDERGVHYMEKGTAGTSRWMDEAEAKEAFTVGDIYHIQETVYGMFDDKGNKVVGYKKPKKASGNQNRIIFGSPGTGKSYAYGSTELCQAIRRGDSFVTTDPSAEHCRTMALLAKSKGYVVWVLNLVNPEYSNFWNCVNETINPDTGRLDGTRLNDFAEVYMKNSSDNSAKQDQFWVAAATNLLKAAIGHASWVKEEYILSSYRELYKKVGKKSKEKDIVLEQQMVGMVSFTSCEKIIKETASMFGYDLNEVEEILKSIKKNAPKFTITEVFNDLMNFKKIASDFALMPLDHPGRMAYQIYATSTSETVQGSALQGILLRMQLFTDPKLAAMLSHDEIDLSQINRQKTAVFVIISDKSTATKPIASLFFSFFFDDVMSSWDKQQDIADEEGKPNSCLPVTVMLDEFYSIGVIGGDPDTFTVVMSNSRKRQLHISIIIQAWDQIPSLYGKDNAPTIMTCCDTILFLGANDPDTCKLISEFVAGTSTVLSERHKEDQSILGPFKSQFDDVQHTTTSRPLLTQDEVKRWKDKMLVSQRGCLPLELKIFPYTLHPYYLSGQIVKKSIKSIIGSSEERIKQINAENKEHEMNIQQKIASLKSRFEPEKKSSSGQKHEQISLDVEKAVEEKPQKKRGTNRGSSKANKKVAAETGSKNDGIKPSEDSTISELF